jgi:hypothetical protein
MNDSDAENRKYMLKKFYLKANKLYKLNSDAENRNKVWSNDEN